MLEAFLHFLRLFELAAIVSKNYREQVVETTVAELLFQLVEDVYNTFGIIAVSEKSEHIIGIASRNVHY